MSEDYEYKLCKDCGTSFSIPSDLDETEICNLCAQGRCIDFKEREAEARAIIEHGVVIVADIRPCDQTYGESRWLDRARKWLKEGE